LFTSTWFFFRRVGGWVQVPFVLILGYGGSLLGTFNLQQKNYKITYSHPPPSPQKKKQKEDLHKIDTPTYMNAPKKTKLKSGDETTF
jgi:hypothetical protein